MALQKTGVQLVAENESGFLGAMGRAQKAVQGFEGAVGKSTPALGGMNIASLALGSALGSALYNGAIAAAQGFINLAKSAFTVTAEYERLSVSMQTLLAREIRAAGAATDMGTAFDMAAPAARELLDWIEQLAIISPFDQAGVAAAYQTLQVYGFLSLGAESVADAQAKGIVTAQRLTEALINQASVSSRGAETMGLVSYALGQIRTAGKLLMQDLRQLMNAGVDVNAILGEMGYSLADVGKEAISSDAFLLKFVETIERDLGGAAAKQAGTLTGLANSLADLGKKYLREFFGPFNEGTGKMGGLLGVLQPILQKFVDTLMNPALIESVRTLGLLLGEGLSGGLSGLSNILTSVVNTISKPFTSAANSAFSWGANIIVSLAQGIINAAGSILISAINFVGQILANWFAPGSPPKVAPDLIFWGKAAMGEFLHGFTTADFDVLKGIQNPLQSALQVMLQSGDIDAQELADTYAEITAGLAEALAGGTDPSAIFDKIADEAGAFGPELAELAKRQFDLAAGVEAVKSAETDLANARKAEEQAGLAVNRLTQEYNDLLRGGASDAQLQAKLEEINAAETAKDIAGQQADEAETQLDIAKDNLDVLEEQVKLQQELVNQLIELARLQAQAIPPEEPEPPGGTGGGGGEPPGLPGIELPDPGEAVQSFLDKIIEQIKASAAQMFAPIQAAWDNAVAGILNAWNNMWANLQASGLLEQLQGIWDNAVALAQIGISILNEFIQGGLQTLANIWEEHKGKVAGIWSSFWGLVASIAGGFLGLIISNIHERLEEARAFWEDHRGQVSSIISGFWTNTENLFSFGLGKILGFVQGRLDSIRQAWEENKGQILGAIDSMWDSIAEMFWNALDGLLETIDANLQTLEDWWNEHKDAVETIVDFFLGDIGESFDTFINDTLTNVSEFLTGIATFWEEHKDTVNELVDLMFELVQGVFETSLDILGGLIETFAGAINEDWTQMKDGLLQIWQGFWDGIELIFATARDALLLLVEGFITNFKLKFTNPDWGSIGSDIVNGIAGGITSAAGALVSAIEQAIADAIAAAKRALGISSPSKVFANFGANISLGMAQGIDAERRAPLDALGETIGAMINPPMVSQPAGINNYMNTLNVNMNNSVAGGIDMALLDARIINTIKRAFRT